MVHHFSDSVTVINENTKAIIAAFGIAGSPWYMAFSSGTAGVNQANPSEVSISVFPNPTTGSIVIAMPDSKARKIILSDMSGRVLSEQQASSVYVPVDVSGLPVGAYYFTIISDNQIEKTVKWLKQ